MATQQILEMIGYASSVLILISLLMTSVVKFRVINGIGSLIFAIYAVCIHSYPTAVLNFCLVAIDIWFLVKVMQNKTMFSAIAATLEDGAAQHFLGFYEKDIAVMFPGYARKDLTGNICFLAYANAEPVEILAGDREGDSLTVTLEYSAPSYRDTTVGQFLYRQLPAFGIARVQVPYGIDRHNKYLESIGFRLEGDHYIKEL